MQPCAEGTLRVLLARLLNGHATGLQVEATNVPGAESQPGKQTARPPTHRQTPHQTSQVGCWLTKAR